MRVTSRSSSIYFHYFIYNFVNRTSENVLNPVVLVVWFITNNMDCTVNWCCAYLSFPGTNITANMCLKKKIKTCPSYGT